MAISGRFVLLAAAGVVAVLLFPGSTALWLWAAFLCAAAGVDVLAAASPRALTLQRTEPVSVRLTEPATVLLTVRNGSRRTLNGWFRDGWQPSAGAVNPVQRMHVPAGEAKIGRAHV